MDLVNFFKTLSRRKWLILAVALTATLATYLLASRSPKLYVSTAQLATGFTDKQEDRNENTTNAINDKFSNFIELTNSPNYVSMVSYRLILNDLTSRNPFRNMNEIKKSYSTEDLVQSAIIYKNKLDSLKVLISETEAEETAINILKSAAYDDKYLLKHIEVKRIPHTDFVEIKFTSENSHLSAFAVNTFCQEIIRYYNYIKLNKIEKSLIYYTNLVAQKKRELNSKVDSLDAFKLSNEVTNYGLETQSKLDQIARLQFNLDEENKKILAITQAIKTISSQLHQENRVGAEEKDVNNRIYELRKKITEVNNRYVIGDMKDRRLNDSLKILRAELDIQIANSGSNSSNRKDDLIQKKVNLEVELGIANSNVSSINNSISSLKNNLTGFTAKEATIDALQMAITVAKEEYLQILDRFNALKNLSLNSGNVHQIELGMPSDFPLPSNKLLMTLLAGIISIIFCVVGIFILEYIDDSIKTTSKFQQSTNLPLLGYLNELKTTNLDFETLYHHTSNDSKLEMYKELLRKIRFETEAANAKVLLCTSAQKGEGKSFVVLSLAYSLSFSNHKVLIIDANFKNNALTQLLSEKANSDMLINEETRNNEQIVNFENYISATKIKNLDIIGCKMSSMSPSEIYTPEKWQELFSFVSHRYDYILVEVADLNLYADTKELTPYAQKIIAVFSAEKTIKQVDQTSIQYLKTLKAKFAGSILNKVKNENLNA